MILLLAVAAGLLAGWLRARIRRQPYQAPELKWVWLVFLAVLPQIFTFHIERTAGFIPNSIAPFVLVSSQCLLLAFVWVNRSQPGFWTLGLGLALNLVTIIANGGWMPISPQTTARMYPEVPAERWTPGERLGTSKDILLSFQDMRLPWFADRFTFPGWSPYQVAFSFGDVLIALGTYWLLWSGGSES